MPAANNINRTLLASLREIVGRRNVLTRTSRTRFYTTGFRYGSGRCLAVARPASLLEIWRVLELCIDHDKAIILQAANTGLNGGSTPFGDDYDRDIVIVNTLKVNKLVLLNGGEQVLAFAGARLNALEKMLASLGRGPHSVIGSSCIGASIVGGVCNNSGGNLVNRGPAYSELALYAQLDANGQLALVNHLGIELGTTPEEILANLESGNFNRERLEVGNRQASDGDYQLRVRDYEASTPARFNANPRRLHEASGCAGKLAVFAVRLDTFPNPAREQVFYAGSNEPRVFNTLRRRILGEFAALPEMVEYMHRSYFDGSATYSKDTFLMVKHLGSQVLPRFFVWRSLLESYLGKIPFLPRHPVDRLMQWLSRRLPDHLPQRMRSYRDRFEHHLIIKASDESIASTEKLLRDVFADTSQGDYFRCEKKEAEAALLHRFVAGGAYSRYAAVHDRDKKSVLALDIALPRNTEDWYQLFPDSILSRIEKPFQLAHFLCMVFHHDLILKPGVDAEDLKAEILQLLDERGAKYPAEHNVGHFYKAEDCLVDHYKNCDPCNTFNPGVGQTSKKKFYR